jgi:glycerate 2-kinase
MIGQAKRQRNAAREIFFRALDATTVAAAVSRNVRCDRSSLFVGGRTYELSRYSEVCIVSMGKAGASLFDAVDVLLPPTLKRNAVVSAPAPPQRMSANVRYFCGGHPEPNAASIDAARAALDAVSACAEDALVLLLISGGASAMCELPASDSVTLDDLILLNRLLIGSGASIAEINCVRKHLSCIKGGRFAVQAGTREKITLLVSDVPVNSLDALGSGPTLPDSTTVDDCLAIIARYALRDKLPQLIQALLAAGLDESPKPEHTAFCNAASVVLMDNATLLEQAADAAHAMGYHVEVDSSCDDWDYADAANHLLAKLETLRGRGKKVCLLSGGEVTVRLPQPHGTGGRNLQFCLHCAATNLAAGTTILSAGTDGIDGNSPAAGAVADATTRIRRSLKEMETHLRNFDAYNFFARLGDAIVTGPTGNNLRDIRILLWEDP